MSKGKTHWLNARQLAAIRDRLEYVDGLNSGPTGSKLSERDEDFAEAKRVIDTARPGDQIFLVRA